MTRFEFDHTREAGDDCWIVGCNNYDPPPGCPLEEQGQHILSVVRIEFRRRLVGYDDARVARKGTSDPDALTLASRNSSTSRSPWSASPTRASARSDQSLTSRGCTRRACSGSATFSHCGEPADESVDLKDQPDFFAGDG